MGITSPKGTAMTEPPGTLVLKDLSFGASTLYQVAVKTNHSYDLTNHKRGW